MNQVTSNLPLFLFGVGVFLGLLAVAGTNIVGWIQYWHSLKDAKELKAQSDRRLAEMDRNVSERKALSREVSNA